jgi:L-ribulose-5-phosphate 3-epimerase
MHKVGFLQGRLSPKPPDRIQSFPKDSWQKEFELAKELGFDCVELIYEVPNLEANPLASPQGRKSVVALSQKYDIQLHSICADYFMERKLPQHFETARELLSIATDIGCSLIEFPFVDSSSLKTEEERNDIVSMFRDLSEVAQQNKLRIALETDLAPLSFRSLLGQLPSDIFGANFDMGNSAALGYDVKAECLSFGDRILNVHVKDRVLGGTTVPLQTGHVDFERVFSSLAQANYRGDFILQTAPSADFLGVAKKYQTLVRDWTRKYINGPRT